MIKKTGNQYVLYNKKGTKILGKHSTKGRAIKQEQAIKINKKKREKQ